MRGRAVKPGAGRANSHGAPCLIGAYVPNRCKEEGRISTKCKRANRLGWLCKSNCKCRQKGRAVKWRERLSNPSLVLTLNPTGSRRDIWKKQTGLKWAKDEEEIKLNARREKREISWRKSDKTNTKGSRNRYKKQYSAAAHSRDSKRAVSKHFSSVCFCLKATSQDKQCPCSKWELLSRLPWWVTIFPNLHRHWIVETSQLCKDQQRRTYECTNKCQQRKKEQMENKMKINCKNEN